MGCAICATLKEDHYREKAGDCLFCMGVNVVIAIIICGAAVAIGAPGMLVGFAFVLMLLRIYNTGYLFPDTPRWLPYVDFIFRPFGEAATKADILSEFTETALDMCEGSHDSDDDVRDCVQTLGDVLSAHYDGELTEWEFLAALGEALDASPEEVRRRLENEDAL